MITLTNPLVVASALGGSSGISYDTFEVTLLHVDVVNQTLSGVCRLQSSSTPTAAKIPGTFTIIAGPTPNMSIAIPTVQFTASVGLSSGQQALLITSIGNAQNNTETAMVNAGAVVGTQSAGL